MLYNVAVWRHKMWTSRCRQDQSQAEQTSCFQDDHAQDKVATYALCTCSQGHDIDTASVSILQVQRSVRCARGLLWPLWFLEQVSGGVDGVARGRWVDGGGHADSLTSTPSMLKPVAPAISFISACDRSIPVSGCLQYRVAQQLPLCLLGFMIHLSS
jgi:hypothetical protein